MKITLIRGLAPFAAAALLLPMAAGAQTTSFTATGWVNAVLSPGIYSTNALGQILYRAGVETARVQGSDPRVAGQVLVITDASMNADGTANLQGPAYLQVGAWDAAGTNFTPNGAMWELNWRGVMPTNNSLRLSLAGYGAGGTIDGWRLEASLTRGPAADPLAPTVPWLYAGTIKPPPLSTSLFADDFSEGLAWTRILKNGGTVTMNAVGGQLVTHEDWTGVSPGYAYLYAPDGAWSIGDGQTLECQADLISLSQNATNVAFVFVSTEPAGSAWYQFNYESGSGPHTLSLSKGDNGGNIFFWATNAVQVPSTNVVLYMALTRDGGNLIITTRVLDKGQQNAVVFERSFVDTPGVDPSLSAAQITALTGTTLVPGQGAPDPGPPILSGVHKGVGVWQITDGGQPAVDAIWDNFSLRLHDVPPINIARAVQISWPVPAGLNYSVEGAPTIQGPWLPLEDLTIPGMQKVAIPASSPAQFFRLIQAP